jgi:hypothetical protein
MTETVTAAARDVAVSGYSHTPQSAPSASAANASLTEAALLALKLAPDIILGAHLAGLKSGDRITGQLILRQQESTLLLVTERGVFAVSPKENLPTSGAVSLQISSVGRTLQAIVQQAARQLDINLTLIALPPATENESAPMLATADDARTLAKSIMQEMPRLADLLRILPEQAHILAQPKTSVPTPGARTTPLPAAAPASSTAIALLDVENPTTAPVLASVLAVLEEEALSYIRSGPIAQLLSSGKAALLRALPPAGTVLMAALEQAGQPPRTVILPAGFTLGDRSQAIILLERPAGLAPDPSGITLKDSGNASGNAPGNAPGIFRHFPAPGERLGSQLALIFNMLGNNPVADMLPPSTELTVLRDAISSMRHTEIPGDASTKINLPLRIAGDVIPLQFVFYRLQEDDESEGKKNGRAHATQHAFDVSVTFPKLGAVKLAGLYHQSHLSMTVHTETAIPEPLQQELSALYAQALQSDNWSGNLHFRAMPENQAALANA